MKSAYLVRCSAAVMGGIVAVTLTMSPGTASAGSCCNDKKSTPTATMGAGLRIQLDENGNRVAEPKAAALPAALATRSQGAPVVRQSASGGLRMSGRQFISASTATINAEGKVEVNCVTINGTPAEVK